MEIRRLIGAHSAIAVIAVALALALVFWADAPLAGSFALFGSTVVLGALGNAERRLEGHREKACAAFRSMGVRDLSTRKATEAGLGYDPIEVCWICGWHRDAHLSEIDPAALAAQTIAEVRANEEHSPRRGGPLKCPKGPCSDCEGAREDNHHFGDIYTEYALNEPEHEAAKLGIEVWYECKHCDAWLEEFDEDDDPPTSSDRAAGAAMRDLHDEALAGYDRGVVLLAGGGEVPTARALDPNEGLVRMRGMPGDADGREDTICSNCSGGPFEVGLCDACKEALEDQGLQGLADRVPEPAVPSASSAPLTPGDLRFLAGRLSVRGDGDEFLEGVGSTLMDAASLIELLTKERNETRAALSQETADRQCFEHAHEKMTQHACELEAERDRMRPVVEAYRDLLPIAVDACERLASLEERSGERWPFSLAYRSFEAALNNAVKIPRLGGAS